MCISLITTVIFGVYSVWVERYELFIHVFVSSVTCVVYGIDSNC